MHALMRAILHALMRRWIGTCDLKQYYAVCGIVAELQCGVSVNLKLFMKNGNNYANVVWKWTNTIQWLFHLTAKRRRKKHTTDTIFIENNEFLLCCTLHNTIYTFTGHSIPRHNSSNPRTGQQGQWKSTQGILAHSVVSTCSNCFGITCDCYLYNVSM